MEDIFVTRDEVVLITQVRDESTRLPFFLDYYRRLGVSKFFIVDNGSVDGTKAILEKAPDVYPFANDSRYEGSWAAIRPILETFCLDRWCLHVDADELLVLPFGNNEQNLPTACRRLEEERATALHSFMVDMYSKDPLAKTPLVSGENLFERCPYFDPPERGANKEFTVSSPRMRLFGLYNNLEKVPLFFYRPGVETTGAGSRTAHELVNVSRFRKHGVIAHFKFLDDLFGKTDRAIAEKSYWNSSAEYVHIAKRLRPDAVAYFYKSLEFVSIQSFEEAGFFAGL